MIAMLRLQFIIFSLIGIGFVTRKKGIVSREGQRSITDLVINVVLPCNIVTSFVQELPDSALRDCAMIFLISVGMEAMCMLYARIAYRNVEANKQKCLTYGILVSNAGFLGNPVAEGVYGPMGLMLASVYLINRDLQRRIRPPTDTSQSIDAPLRDRLYGRNRDHAGGSAGGRFDRAGVALRHAQDSWALQYRFVDDGDRDDPV